MTGGDDPAVGGAGRVLGPETIRGCRLVDLPRIRDHRGNLSFVEGGRHVPFAVRRVYYLYDVPAGEARGGHAHLALEQLLIAVSGSFDVMLDDGHRSHTVTLNRPFVGLYMSNMIWRELLNFASGSVCLVLASQPYDEADYIRVHDEFRRLARAQHGASAR